MRFKNKSRLRRTRNRNRGNKISYTGGAFDSWFGTTIVGADKNKKKLIISFDNNVDITNNNIRIYIRISLTNPKKRDFSMASLPHVYLDVPISDCTPSDMVKIKYLHMLWFKSLSEEVRATIPDFRWIDAFTDRWTSIDETYKKKEFGKIHQSFSADYSSLYSELLKYEDPFGGAFDYKTQPPSLVTTKRTKRTKRTNHHKTAASVSVSASTLGSIDSILEKMNRANAELETQQERLQTRRNGQKILSTK